MNNESEHWSSASVSWAQLFIAIAGLLLALAGSLVLLEGRLTRLEERQIFVLKYIVEDTTANTAKEKAIATSLIGISHQLEELKLEIVRHIASGDRSTDKSK